MLVVSAFCSHWNGIEDALHDGKDGLEGLDEIVDGIIDERIEFLNDEFGIENGDGLVYNGREVFDDEEMELFLESVREVEEGDRI